MKHLYLGNLQLKTLTEKDFLDYSQINDINPNEIIFLNLFNNQLSDISGINIFKNLIILNLGDNYFIKIYLF